MERDIAGELDRLVFQQEIKKHADSLQAQTIYRDRLNDPALYVEQRIAQLNRQLHVTSDEAQREFVRGELEHYGKRLASIRSLPILPTEESAELPKVQKARIRQSSVQSLVETLKAITAKIGWESFLAENKGLSRTTGMAYQASGGNPVRGKLSAAMCATISAAVLASAKRHDINSD